MSKIKLTSEQIKNLYNQTYSIYHLHSILNNILLNQLEFHHLDITNLSIVNERKLNSLRKQLLHLIPMEK